MHLILFIRQIFPSTCFEYQALNLQEDTVVCEQHMAPSLSVES